MNRNDSKYYLQKYINGGCLTSFDRLLYFFSPDFVFKRNVQIIQSCFSQSERENSSSAISIDIKFYDGENKFVIDLMNFLDNNLKDQLAGVYVHGSLGTNEEIAYSDFDALVILKDDIFNDERRFVKVASLLNKARMYMFQMDPLQHHGWFVLKESDLKNYPETYFPSELFRHAKSLLKGDGQRLTLNLNQSEIFSAPAISLCKSIHLKLQSSRPSNTYGLKNLFSEFMLLPALYVQARDKKGIYKKFSFEEAKKDFSPDEWKIMDEVSLIRKNWYVKISGWKRNIISSESFFSFHPAKLLAPAIPDDLKSKLDKQFYKSMLDFTTIISNKLK